MRFQSSILLLISTLLFASMAYGQSGERLKVFSPVPINERQHLAERLKTFVGYHRSERWDKVFQMLPKAHTQHPELKLEDFLVNARRGGEARIAEFTPQYTTENPTVDGDYAIYGCTYVRKGRDEKRWQAVTYASLENGEWVFSDILFTFLTMHAREPAPCESNNKH